VRSLLSNSYASLVSRFILGGVFIAAGIPKILDPGAFAVAIRSYELALPEWFVSFSAHALPYAEVLIGLYLVFGLFTKPTAWLTTALMLVFTVALLQGAVRGLDINCGCFGAGEESSNLWLAFLRDIGLIALCLHIAFAPLSRFSVDALLFRRERREPSEA
jgi:putative oxidoreductase